MNTILQDLIEHHAWANETLLTYCETLSPEQLALTAPGTFGTVEETLVHLAANEEGYLQGLAEVGVAGAMETTIFDGSVPRELASVRPVLAKTAAAWRQVVTDWAANAVKGFAWEGTVARLPVSVFVGQAINHGTEHRGHIRSILSIHGLEPPTIDFWAWNEATSPAGPAGTTT